MLRPKNVLTRFREFFKALPDHEQKELWDVLVALRGDDAEKSSVLKMLSTSRIRGELFRVTHKAVLPFGAYIFQTLKQAEQANSGYRKPTLIELREEFREASDHWKTHTVNAIRHIIKYNPSRARDLKKFVRMIRW